MKYHVPTVEELMVKPASELQAIFQNAAETAASGNISDKERAAAKLTLARLAFCHKSPQKPRL